MTQTTARHFCHLYPQRGHHRHQHQTGLIAHAACGVLVGGNARDTAEIQCLTGAHHFHRQMQGLLGVHATEEHRHQKRGHLVIGNGSLGIAIYNEMDLFLGQLAAITLLGNYFGHQHGSFLLG